VAEAEIHTRVDTGKGPLPAWRALVDQGVLQHDPAQETLAEALQKPYLELTRQPSGLRKLISRAEAVPGLYVHGGVGRGKTLLMDLMAAALKDARIPVRRIHFHRFMDEVHEGLNAHGGHRDPLRRIAREMAARARVLCFDEFHVSDIGDAMILGELLAGLFDEKVTLIATSNTAPEDLYADGLQRERFLPAIELIQSRCRGMAMADGEDHRLRELTRHPVYYTPIDDESRAHFEAEFDSLVAGETVSDNPIKIRARLMKPVARAGSVVWFDFRELCGGPRSSGDYIELSRRFSTLLVSDLPAFDDNHNDPARRFVHLIDECYDRSVKVIVLAAVPVTDLYTGKRLAGPFERTTSRLIEMQSRDYLARPHRP